MAMIGKAPEARRADGGGDQMDIGRPDGSPIIDKAPVGRAPTSTCGWCYPRLPKAARAGVGRLASRHLIVHTAARMRRAARFRELDRFEITGKGLLDEEDGVSA